MVPRRPNGQGLLAKAIRFAYHHHNADGLVIHKNRVLVAANGGNGAVEATAYGRLNHAPNGEGVVYCLEPTVTEHE